MIAAGIDGSLTNFGLAIGVVNLETKRIVSLISLKLSKTSVDNTIKRSMDDLNRFHQHHTFIREAIAQYKIERVYVEVPAGARDARASFTFGGITSLYASLDRPVCPLTPLQVKEWSTGFKHSEKEDMIKWAYEKYPNADWIKGKKANQMDIKTSEGYYLTNANEHIADALGCLYSGVTKNVEPIW